MFLPDPRFQGGSETSLKRLARLVLRDGLVASPLLPETVSVERIKTSLKRLATGEASPPGWTGGLAIAS